MKKVLLALACLMTYVSYGQISISNLPTYTGSPSGGYVPIVVGGTTKKIDAGKFGLDSTKLAYLSKNNRFTGNDTFPAIVLASGGTDTLATKAYARSVGGGLPYQLISGYISSTDSNTFSIIILNDPYSSSWGISKQSVGVLHITSSVSIPTTHTYFTITPINYYNNSFQYIFYNSKTSFSSGNSSYIQIFDSNGSHITQSFANIYFEIKVYP